MKIRKEFLVVLLIVLACGLFFSIGFDLPFQKPPSSPSLTSLEEAFTTIAEEIKPAVVNISTVQVVKGMTSPTFDDAFEDWFFKDFQDFFGKRKSKEYKQESLGSGFIFKIEGDTAYILTNNHVVAMADEINVKFANGDEVKVKEKPQGDQRTDVAILKIEAKRGLKAIRLGDSDKIKVGQWVIAVGNPFGFDRTVTVGIISGTGRHLSPDLYAIQDFIQTDAAINRGNSGGPLLNIRGEVIGMNTAIIDPSRAQGVGFAVPINMAREVADSFLKHGRVIRGWLGVIIQPVSEEIAEAFGLPDRKGALVSDITPDGPAQKAGIEKGDVIREVGGKIIDSVDTLTKFVRRLEVGKEVEVRVIRRGGKQLSLKVVIGEMPEEGDIVTGGKANLGLGVQDSEQGVIVTEVEQGSPADRARVRPRDIILKINNKPIKNVADYNKVISSLKEEKYIDLLVQRGNYTIYLVIKK